MMGVSGKEIGEVDGEAGNGQQEEGSQVGGGLGDPPPPRPPPLLPSRYSDLEIEDEETFRCSPPLDSRSVHPG